MEPIDYLNRIDFLKLHFLHQGQIQDFLGTIRRQMVVILR